MLNFASADFSRHSRSCARIGAYRETELRTTHQKKNKGDLSEKQDSNDEEGREKRAESRNQIVEYRVPSFRAKGAERREERTENGDEPRDQR